MVVKRRARFVGVRSIVKIIITITIAGLSGEKARVALGEEHEGVHSDIAKGQQSLLDEELADYRQMLQEREE